MKRIQHICFLAAILLQPLYAEQSSLTLRFTNSANGYGVLPEKVTLRNKSTGATIGLNGDHLGFTSHQSPEPGEWEIAVLANGFHPISSHIVTSAGEPVTVEFYLDPLHPPEELQPHALIMKQRSDATLVTGFVVDDATGLPLWDVSAECRGGNCSN